LEFEDGKVRLANKTAEEVRIAELEAKVSELMGLLQGGK
jgi:hypothetical protein